MKGNIQVIQNYGDNQKVIFQQDNMAVDGVRKTIADIMTYKPNPSGTAAPAYMEVGVSSVSSYQIQAMTLGSAKGYYDKRDSRFWYSATEYSSTNYQQLPLKPNDYFEMFDSYSAIGYNSWMYDNVVDANILQSPTLSNLRKWEVMYKVPEDPSNPAMSRQETSVEGTPTNVTRFELTKGQQAVTLRQQVPLRLGENYYLYTNGKSYQATFDFRIGRGRNGITFEYYDFNNREFVPKTNLDAMTRETILLKSAFDVNEFRFQLKGNEVDQPLELNNEYFVEYVFPAQAFVDSEFSPWENDQQNPYVDIARLELCDASHQILKNPNFLTSQSRMINNDFRITNDLTELNAVRPGLSNSLGYRHLTGWSVVNPILNSDDPGTEELNGDLGSIKPAITSHLESTVFSSMTDGVILYTSGTNLIDSSGAISLAQSFGVGDEVRNDYAFPSLLSDVPTNLNAANGQSDNNSTFMLSLETMVSGTSTAANSGHLQISLLRNSDGFYYSFNQNPITNISNKFEAEDIPLTIPYSIKDYWLQVGVPVVLPADANRDSYTLSIKASGRTDTNGFCNYAIKDFSFGELQGWRTYMYDQSGLALWSLSSQGYTNMTSGYLYSGLSFSGPTTQEFGWSAGYLEAVNDTRTSFKNQIVQNFGGLEPTKSYRLSLKGSAKGDSFGTAPTSTDNNAFLALLKARAKIRQTGKNNILSQYMKDAAVYSGSTYPVSNLNPYSNNGQSFRRTFPQFQKTLEDSTTKPTDWGILLGPSGTGANNYAFEDSRGNEGNYTLSMDVFNSHDEGSYFVLSSAPGAFFDWAINDWVVYDAASPLKPEYMAGTSGTFFLPLPKQRNTDDYTSFKYPHPINFQSVDLEPTDDPTPDDTGSRGTYKITAGLFGPNAAEGSTLVKNISLAGAGEEPNVDMWKDLYYQWETGRWSPIPNQGNINANMSNANHPVRNFVAAPSAIITNMCLYGLGKDTEYQLNIINTSGGEFTFNDVALTDTALIANPGTDRWVRDSSIFTSEFYGNSHYKNYTNGVVIKYYSTLGEVSDPSSLTPPRPAQTPKFASVASQVSSLGVPTLTFPAVNTSIVRYPWILSNFTLDDYGLQGGDEFAFGYDTLLTLENGDVKGYVSMEVESDGNVYHYDFTTKNWIPGGSRREMVFTIEPNNASVISNDTTSFWTKIATPQITAPTFGPNTKMVASLRIVPSSDSNSDILVKDFRMYKTIEARRQDAANLLGTEYRVSGDTFLFPEFPTPMDESLQSKGKTGTPGELGHFLNRIPYFEASSYALNLVRTYNSPADPSITGEKTLEEAVSMGAYLPSEGFYFGPGAFGTSGVSGLMSGTLNAVGVVNSDGYIYQHPFAATNENDASAGFVTSSYVHSPYGGWTHKPKVNRYVLKVHKNDWKFIDYYMGGIGALGLNVFDYKKTHEKLGTSLMVSSNSVSYSQGSRVALYNVADPSRNPVFRLTNKKVTFAPGLHIDYQNTDWLTIIWDIDFLK